MRSSCFHVLLGLFALGLLPLVARAEVKIVFPLNRTAYQTNERIDVAILRSAPDALAACPLLVEVTGADGSRLHCTFQVNAAPKMGAGARATEHLYLNGWLLRPGKYTLAISCDGATANAPFSVYSHIRQSSFRLIDWGTTAQSTQVQAFGENGFGFNLLYGGGQGDHSIMGGLDYMGCCMLGGGHQMELRLECDWSDPYVLQGVAGSAAKTAFQFRTSPNAIGVHLYDEPGLTWLTHPVTKAFSPHNIPAQDRIFKDDFGKDVPVYTEVTPEHPQLQTLWSQKNRWKLSFMEGAWQLAAHAVNRVRPDYIPATQTVYGWASWIDGYYFNIARQLPVISGHGGYDDLGLGYLTPSFFFEFGRARDLNKPNWYLPAWYVDITSDRYRMEQYMSFVNGLQGMAKPPWIQLQTPTKFPASEGIVESNKLMGHLGTIFTTMPVDRPEVAVLYSLSQCLTAQSADPTDFGGHGHEIKLNELYIAGKETQTRLFPVVEEDILDGTLAAHHKMLLLTGVDTLDSRVVRTLEDFIANGGIVVLTDDCQVKIDKAVKLGVAADISRSVKLGQLWQSKTGKSKEESDKIDAQIAALQTVGVVYQEALPMAKALQTVFGKYGIRPDVVTDNTEIFASRQAQGDIEYTFAINAAYDYADAQHNSMKATEASIGLPNDGRPIYDAIHGGMAEGFAKHGALQSAHFRFAPGQMRAFARTARPIGGVQVTQPVVRQEFTQAQNPLRVECAAMLVDTHNQVLAGSAPLRIKVIDPLHVVRYDLYRATDKGLCPITLPLAANDPAGQWTVEVSELLANTVGRASFTLAPCTQCGAVAGMPQRALTFGNDWENIYRFFRTNQRITIVVGTQPFQQAQAERLTAILQPWGIQSTIMKATDVKMRTLTAEEAKTWVGHLSYAGRANIKEGDQNLAVFVGYDLRGGVVLLGTPQDNVLMKTLADSGFLPYAINANFPGPGHALLAWQVEGLRFNEESVTVIAGDADGMTDGVGALLEAASGLNPLTPWTQPDSSNVTGAAHNLTAPEAGTRWQMLVPDRPLWMTADARGAITVCTGDGTLTTRNAAGKVTSAIADKQQLAVKPVVNIDTKGLPAATLHTDRVLKTIAAGPGLTAVAYWGGTLQTFAADGSLKSEQQLPQDISALAWSGDTLVVALADGRVLGLQVK